MVEMTTIVMMTVTTTTRLVTVIVTTMAATTPMHLILVTMLLIVAIGREMHLMMVGVNATMVIVDVQRGGESCDEGVVMAKTISTMMMAVTTMTTGVHIYRPSLRLCVSCTAEGSCA